MPFSQAIRPLLLSAVLGLAACAGKPDAVAQANGIFDPYEAQNRKIHEFNRNLDRALVRPAARGYGTVLPSEVQYMVGSFNRNLGMPLVFTNAVLQADFETAGVAAGRFFINTVFGFVGLIDTATAFEIPDVDTDFGATLAVWGAAEGPYVELPFFGPSTQRDAIGFGVDLLTNPLGFLVSDEFGVYSLVSRTGRYLGDRDQFSDTVDSILYESSDSYAQLRLVYLQNRRFELGVADPTQEIDPFELETEGF